MKKTLRPLWFLLPLLLALAAEFGCTLTPKRVTPGQPSFDGNQQNSGFLGWTANGSAMLTTNAYNRYQSFCAIYGPRMKPSVLPAAGWSKTTNDIWALDKEHCVYFAQWTYWWNNGVR